VSDLEMHFEADIDRTQRCTWNPKSSEFGEALRGHDQSILEKYWEAVNLEAVNLEAVNLEAVNLEVVNLEAINLEEVNPEVVNQEAVNLEAVDQEGGATGG